MNYTLYVHISPSNKYYIGVTCQNVYMRWGHNGLGYFAKRKKVQTPFYYAIQKYGWDNFQHIVLIENLSKEVALMCEQYLINKYHTTDRDFGYNITKGGEGVCGYRHSVETKEKLRKLNKGRQLSEEHKQKISDALKGRPNTWQKGVKPSDDTVHKLSESLRGHLVSEETREKIRKANTGRHPTDEVRRKMSEHNGMHNERVRMQVAESLKKSGKERAEKRKKTIQERYPNGLKHTEESKKKVSAKLKGIPKSDITKQKMQKPKSPEHIEHMREAQRLSHQARKLGMTYKEYIIARKRGGTIEQENKHESNRGEH